jgi:hypothetical protein
LHRGVFGKTRNLLDYLASFGRILVHGNGFGGFVSALRHSMHHRSVGSFM